MNIHQVETRQFDFVLAGNVLVDVIKTIDDYPDKLQLAHVYSIDFAPGGLVCNCAASLMKMDPTLRICAIGKVGRDEEGSFALRCLKGMGNINLDYITRDGITAKTDVMTIGSTGERTFFTYHGAGMQLSPEDIPLSELSGGIFHIGYAMLLDILDQRDTQYGTKLAHVLHDADERGFITSMDVVSDNRPQYTDIVRPALRYTDILSVNELEAERITGIPIRQKGIICRAHLQEACEALLQMGVRKWAVIHMPEVTCGMDREKGYQECSCLKLPPHYIQGSVGAGDVFTSALLLGAYRGRTLQEALKAGNAVAACALSRPGVAEGVLPPEEALKLFSIYPVQE